MYLAGELRCRVTTIGPEVNGFIYRSRKGNLYILADETLSPEALEQTVRHEAFHAVHDLRPGEFILGLDDHRSEREQSADAYGRSAT